MIPWVKIGSAHAPDGTELSLWQRDVELVVRAGTVDLMSNRRHGSEELLAEHGCEGLGSGGAVLVGGLGFAFTLRAVLARVSPAARVVVAELVPEIVTWARGPVGAGDALDDPRVTVDPRDVAAVLRESRARFDAILLDVDNGPSALTQASNRWLYTRAGIDAAKRALRPGGRLAVWSAGDDPAFVALLGRAGLDARGIHVRAHRAAPGGRGRGTHQTIFLGQKAL